MHCQFLQWDWHPHYFHHVKLMKRCQVALDVTVAKVVAQKVAKVAVLEIVLRLVLVHVLIHVKQRVSLDVKEVALTHV